MEIGLLQIMQTFGYDHLDDGGVYEEEVKIALQAEALGYDHIFVVEHHFEDYAICPDNFVYLSYIAGRTKRIRLGTGAVIVPWNTQPLRVAEKAALLDNLCGGRLILGLGRGLSRREYGQFGIDMAESRDRFDEATPMILDALESGWMEEHKGKFFDQPRAPIRPKPTASFKDRKVQVAMSPDSVIEAARHGAQMVSFSFKEIQDHADEYRTYCEAFKEFNEGAKPPPLMLVESTVCDSDPGRAQELRERYVGNLFNVVNYHYEFDSSHFDDIKGYASYGEQAKEMQQVELSDAAKHFAEKALAGTPQQIIEGAKERLSIVGDLDLVCNTRFAGMPFEVPETTVQLIGKEVLPVIRSL